MKQFILIAFFKSLFMPAVDEATIFRTGTCESSNKKATVILEIPYNVFTESLDYHEMQKGVIAHDKDGNKLKVKPSKVKLYSFIYKADTITMVSKKPGLFKKKRFLKLEKDGDQMKYRSYHKETKKESPLATGILTSNKTQQIDWQKNDE